MVRTLAIKPSSSSINLDKPSSSVVHCIVVRMYYVVILLVKEEINIHYSSGEAVSDLAIG